MSHNEAYKRILSDSAIPSGSRAIGWSPRLLRSGRSVLSDSHIVAELHLAHLSALQLLLKRAIDIFVAFLALVGLLPLLFVIVVAIKVDSDGPSLFYQTRRGYGGKPFRIYKFRTMHVMEDGAAVQQACPNDPRITRVGCFLRSSSLDELPQLFNVLLGDMSLVGPRPHAIAHDDLYAQLIENYRVRQLVKPGITGWAQIHGLRGPTEDTEKMRQRIDFDIWYVTNASLLLDCKILLKTLPEIVRPHNAY